MANVVIEGLEEALIAAAREGARQALAERGLEVAQSQGWLSIERAAVYLDMTPEAIRSAVKRGQLMPCRTPTGRVRFSRERLDQWVRGGAGAE
jgi:excisionase family DNA binding protein